MDQGVKLDLISARSNGQSFEQRVTDINESLAPHGLQLAMMEEYSAEDVGRTVFFKSTGNKQLASDFVPNDPRNGRGVTVPYGIDGTELGTSSGMSDAATYNAMDNAMQTWEAVTCSDGLELPSWGPSPFDVGYVQYLLGYGGRDLYYPGVILHSGILSADFFNAIRPGGGSNILGITFTFWWVNDSGTPTDIDGDGKLDVAIKEIYYNDGFNWQDEPNDVLGNGIYDLETVALHEAGHGLSQAHFGSAFRTNNGKLHFAPYALMNAGYSIARRTVEATDEAGHCSNWGSWPNE